MVPAYLDKYVEPLSTFTTHHKLQRRKTGKKKKRIKVILPGGKPIKLYIRREVARCGCLGPMWTRLLLKDAPLTSDQHGIRRGRHKWKQLSVKNGSINMSFVVPTSQCISMGPNELSEQSIWDIRK